MPTAAGRGRSAASPSACGVMAAQAAGGGGTEQKGPFGKSQAVFDLGTAASSWQKPDEAGRGDRSAELQSSNIPGRAHPPQRPGVGSKAGRRKAGPTPSQLPGTAETSQAVCCLLDCEGRGMPIPATASTHKVTPLESWTLRDSLRAWMIWDGLSSWAASKTRVHVEEHTFYLRMVGSN